MKNFQVKLKYKESIVIQNILLKKYKWPTITGAEIININDWENFSDDKIIYL